MAVVVEQTIPFQPEALDLDNSSRWNTLFPLIRPTVKVIQTPKGQNILVDMAKARGKQYMHIVATGNAGNFSSKLLDDKHVTAIITERRGPGILTAPDVAHSLKSNGFELKAGVVLVKAGKERKIEVHTPHVIEVQAKGELEQDHILHLLGTAKGGTRSNPHETAKMLKVFLESASTAHSTFHTEKANGNPAVLHAEGPSGFEKAKHAVERNLRHAMKAHTAQEGDVVYSVHFSDVNGLSRLENYIIAGEIASCLDSQGVKYALSHSTILDHAKSARGFSISICPIPLHFLDAAPKPQHHEAAEDVATPTTNREQTTSFAQSKIIFDDAAIRRRIQGGCNAVINAEPTITEYDTIVGDGDCGYTLRDGAKQVLNFIKNKDLSRLPGTLDDLVQELEVNMGGTSGALYCIYLTALANALATEDTVPVALQAALEQLCKYTNARVGDRTMMDALIPFIESLTAGDDEKDALGKAEDGVEGTKKMEAKLGRSTYLDESATRGVPDPGAYGLLIFLKGMCLADGS